MSYIVHSLTSPHAEKKKQLSASELPGRQTEAVAIYDKWEVCTIAEIIDLINSNWKKPNQNHSQLVSHLETHTMIKNIPVIVQL